MVDQTVEKVFSLFHKYGQDDYLGEPVSQIEHAVQCAMLAEQEDGTPEVILGSLLHDIGHLVGKERRLNSMKSANLVLGVQRHDVIGEEYMKDLGIPENIRCFSLGHVNAKRYLTYKHKEYHDKLSEASKLTLIQQGGTMKQEEAMKFEKHLLFSALIKMRSWDEKAKVAGLQIEPLEKYKKMLKQCLIKEQ